MNEKLPLHSEAIYEHGMLEGTQYFNYVMFKDGTLLIDQEKQMDYGTEPLRINHNSLAAAHEDPIAAGEMIIDKGRVEKLNEFSGHFKPKGRVQYVEQQLKFMGATFTKHYKMHNYREISFLAPIWMSPEQKKEFLEKKLKEIEDDFNASVHTVEVATTQAGTPVTHSFGGTSKNVVASSLK